VLRLAAKMGEEGVSGACHGESWRPWHPKGRKRRSGCSAGMDMNGRTRELTDDRRGGANRALERSANWYSVELSRADWIHSSNWVYTLAWDG
jgi:hypothetical protein